MKRLFILTLVVMVSMVLPTHVSAQFDLGKAFNKLIGNDDEPSPYELIAQNAPATSDIIGTWIYDNADIEYFGGNILADYAISEAKSYALSELRKAGVTSGSATLTIKRNGNGVIKWNGETAEGRYSYDESSGSLVITAVIEGKQVQCNGFVRLADNRLTLLIDANDALQAFKTAYPNEANSTAVSLAEGVLSNFSQIYGAGYFRRK